MEQKNIAQTALDQMVTNDQSQMLKAAVPYLPQKGQQIVSLFTKIQELMTTARLFSPGRTSMQICSAPAEEPMDIIQNIRQFTYGPCARQLDQVSNMLAVVEMMKLMKE